MISKAIVLIVLTAVSHLMGRLTGESEGYNRGFEDARRQYNK